MRSIRSYGQERVVQAIFGYFSTVPVTDVMSEPGPRKLGQSGRKSPESALRNQIKLSLANRTKEHGLFHDPQDSSLPIL